MSKKITGLALACALALSLVACGQTPASGAASAAGSTAAPAAMKTLVVGATVAPHAEILEAAKPLLAAEGIELVIKEFDDYVLPNTALDEGDLDANYFQHQPYLDLFNEKNGTELISAGSIH
ncbi:MAG: MetQ/NlpA family ABC transporter substrate-binding protein, partial [Ruthenibacterium sp.]